MARGEPAKEGTRSPGLVTGAVFGLACLAAATLVLTTSRSCVGCVPRSWLGPPPAPPPFRAASALGALGLRDAMRARSYGGPPPPDPALAAASIEGALGARGYRELPADPSERPLPFEAALPALEGQCGVAVVVASGHGTIERIETAEESARAVDPSVAALGLCGTGTVRASGTGSAVLRVFTLPGLTPQDVAATGAPADVLLAHAEAEILLAGAGLVPEDQLVRTDVGPTGVLPVPPGPLPATDCGLWVGVVTGGGGAASELDGWPLDRDLAIDRSFVVAAACPSGPVSTATVEDGDGDGYAVFWRAYGETAAGPVRTPGHGTIVPTTGAARLVTTDTARPAPPVRLTAPP